MSGLSVKGTVFAMQVQYQGGEFFHLLADHMAGFFLMVSEAREEPLPRPHYALLPFSLKSQAPQIRALWQALLDGLGMQELPRAEGPVCPAALVAGTRTRHMEMHLATPATKEQLVDFTAAIRRGLGTIDRRSRHPLPAKEWKVAPPSRSSPGPVRSPSPNLPLPLSCALVLGSAVHCPPGLCSVSGPRDGGGMRAQKVCVPKMGLSFLALY